MGVSASDTTACSECGSHHIQLDYDHAELVCVACGLVLEESLPDPGPDWHPDDRGPAFSQARAGPPDRKGMALSTEISSGDRDATGQRIPWRRRSRFFRLREWHNRVRRQRRSERNLADASRNVASLIAALKLPERVRDAALEIYKLALEKPAFYGRPADAIVTAALLQASRQEGVPRTLAEISRYSTAQRRDISRTRQLLLRHLEIDRTLPVPADYLPRICSRLGLPPRVETLARRILVAASEKQLPAAAPVSQAAAAVYLAGVLLNERRRQKDVARAADVSDVTVRGRYKDLMEHLTLEVRV